ncbi:unnamed protein product [Diamesa tonsa]
MEPPAEKRRKKNAIEVLDPIAMFTLENISIDHILDYFDEEDLLNASLVSYLWYERIGQSRNFKEKVVIKVGKWNHYFLPKSTAGSIAIRDSIRQYEIFVNYNQVVSTEANFLPSKAWKSITTNINTYVYSSQFIDYCKKFNTTVEKLEIIKAHTIFQNSINEISFPCLKELELVNVNTNTLKELAVKHPQLNSFYLKVRHDEENERHRGIVIKFLRLNCILNRFELSCYSDLFNVDLTEHLSLRICRFKYQMKRKTNQVNLSKFLKMISPSLKTLEITVGHESELMLNRKFIFLYDSWNSMKSLEYLEFNLEAKEMYIAMDLTLVNQMEVSKSLKHIEMTIGVTPFTRSVWAMIQIILLASSDTLEILELSHITKAMFDFIIHNLPKLKTLIAGCFNFACSSYYTQIKTEQGSHNSNIAIDGIEIEPSPGSNGNDYAVSGYYSDHHNSSSTFEDIGHEGDVEDEYDLDEEDDEEERLENIEEVQLAEEFEDVQQLEDIAD